MLDKSPMLSIFFKFQQTVSMKFNPLGHEDFDGCVDHCARTQGSFPQSDLYMMLPSVYRW